jgi:hypothetical protein
LALQASPHRVNRHPVQIASRESSPAQGGGDRLQEFAALAHRQALGGGHQLDELVVGERERPRTSRNA